MLPSVLHRRRRKQASVVSQKRNEWYRYGQQRQLDFRESGSLHWLLSSSPPPSSSRSPSSLRPSTRAIVTSTISTFPAPTTPSRKSSPPIRKTPSPQPPMPLPTSSASSTACTSSTWS